MEKLKGKNMHLTGFAIKRIAVISMIIDHVGGFIVKPFFLENFGTVVSEAQAVQSMRWYYLIEICSVLGSIAFPLFCFLLAEGFSYSKTV